MSEEKKEFSYYDATPEEIEKHERREAANLEEGPKVKPVESGEFSYYDATPEEIDEYEKRKKVVPAEEKLVEPISEKTEKVQEPILEQKVADIKKEENKNDKAEQIKEAIDELISLAERKNILWPQFDKQHKLMHKFFGNKEKDAQISEEYTKVYNEWKDAVEKVAKLTNMSEEQVKNKYSGEKSEKGEKTPEDERKLKEAHDFLNEKRGEINKEVENLEQGKKGSFEKLKAIVKDRRFQIILGLAIAGVAIAAPPTGFVSMITFGMHPGFLPAVYVMETKVIEGIIGGALISKGIYDNAEKIKEKGINLVEGMKKSEKAN